MVRNSSVSDGISNEMRKKPSYVQSSPLGVRLGSPRIRLSKEVASTIAKRPDKQAMITERGPQTGLHNLREGNLRNARHTAQAIEAQAIHEKSRRAKKAFIKVNCSALSESLLESELFGHVKGAYTDAISDRIGRFQLADKGTIFLDEIGDLSLTIQVKLLRALQEGVIERVGDPTPMHVDARIICATNKDLKKLIN